MEFVKRENVKCVNWVVLDWNMDVIWFYEKIGVEVFDDWWLVEMSKNVFEKLLK